MRVAVVGRGKLGRALANALARAGAVSVPGRRLPRKLDASVTILAVPDDELARVASALAPLLERDGVLLHTAGARGLEELASARQRGISVGVMHPLASFASRTRSPQLTGTTFTLFGERRAVLAGTKVARMIGARPLVLKGQPGPAYHAAAALVANGATALAAHGVAALRALGIEQRAAEQALGGLLQTVAGNVGRLGVPAALTGPVARGDARTVREHLEALRALDPELAEVYRAVQPALVRTARELGLGQAEARAILRQLAR